MSNPGTEGTGTYDVAISFLSDDADVAQELHDRLSGSLRVLVYTRDQRSLAGTDGAEVLSRAFGARATLAVILLRDGYGKTQWTRLELEAIKGRCFESGFEGVFVLTLDDECKPPAWIPRSKLHFRLSQFTLDQAAAAIQARAMELRSEDEMESAGQRSDRLASIVEFRTETQRLKACAEGVGEVVQEFRGLREHLDLEFGELQRKAPSLTLRIGSGERVFGVSSSKGSVEVCLRVPYASMLDVGPNQRAELHVSNFLDEILVPGQSGYYRRDPRVISSDVFVPDRSMALGWHWVSGSQRRLSTKSLCARVCESFVKHLSFE